MNENSRRRNILVAFVVIVIIVIVLLLLSRCPREEPESVDQAADTSQPGTVGDSGANAADPEAEEAPEEVLTAATLTAPEQVLAGAAFTVTWTGPDNPGDYVTIVALDAPAAEYASYDETENGPALELTAPIEPGAYEVRYVTERSHTILGRAAIEVAPAGATLVAVDEVILGRDFPVEWTGPNNAGDYVTIVSAAATDDEYGSYVNTEEGSPLTLTAPTETGDAELRYVTGQDRKVLARRPIRIVMAEVTMSAPGEAIAGTTIEIAWTGPDNAGDYITVVAAETPDGQYGNYTNTASGSPLKLLLPIMAGGAELRYMTGQGNRVLARRAIAIVAAEVTLSAPTEGAAGTTVSITWTGPDNPGDYITVVAADAPDGTFRHYANTSSGSPLIVKLPDEPGDAEIRYMTGQGSKVLARVAIKVTR